MNKRFCDRDLKKKKVLIRKKKGVLKWIRDKMKRGLTIHIKDIKLYVGERIVNTINILCIFSSIFFVVVSFYLEDEVGNVMGNLGTGLLISSVVSMLINSANDKRQEREQKLKRKIFLESLYSISLDLYRDIVYRINKYAIQTNHREYYYGFCNNFDRYKNFEKKINIKKLSEIEYEYLDGLLDFNKTKIIILASELGLFSKSRFYFFDLFTLKEFDDFISTHKIAEYNECVRNIDKYWDAHKKDYKECIRFLHMTLDVCSEVIKMSSGFQKDIKSLETKIQRGLEAYYFEEIHSKSPEYARQCEEEYERLEAFYSSAFPNDFKKYVEGSEEIPVETQEDKKIRDLRLSLESFYSSELDSILEKIDSNDGRVLKLLIEESIQEEIKKDRRKQKLIKAKFGRKYKNKARDLVEKKEDT